MHSLIKRIDILLIRGFLPPLLVTFFIATFVLIVQSLWIYIDDIIGKGAGLLFILEMVFYLSISLIPLALPIAILISSVMVMGNLAERFELTSMKSAGVSLLRIMGPLVLMGLLISVFSFFCSNNLIPVSYLKFRTRLGDVRDQKPTLSLEQGVFNEDFQDFVIYIGEKDEDNRHIREVIIYDQEKNLSGKVAQIHAAQGEMFTTSDNQYFIMNLENGVQYEEVIPDKVRNRKQEVFPFVRTSFGKWSRILDLSEFDIVMSDEDKRRDHYKMMTSAQLLESIDTLAYHIARRKERMTRYTRRYFLPLQKLDKDSVSLVTVAEEFEEKTSSETIYFDPKSDAKDSTVAKDTLPNLPSNPVMSARGNFPQKIDRPLKEYDQFVQTFPPQQRENLFNRAKSSARSLRGNAEAAAHEVQRLFERRVKTIFELHLKFSTAAICLIFLFIGAPLGAIVRKGGFGYPILISILFFTLFIVMNILFKNMAEEAVLSPPLAAWLPCLIMLPVGLVLTYQAVNDRKLVDAAVFSRLRAKLRRKKRPPEQ